MSQPCLCCGALVETVLLEADGALHSCPPADLARYLRGQRRPLDERWWAEMQEAAGAPTEPVVPLPRAAPSSTDGLLSHDGHWLTAREAEERGLTPPHPATPTEQAAERANLTSALRFLDVE